MSEAIPDMDVQLHMVTTICAALHEDDLNEDVARGIAFAVGYICGIDDSQENERGEWSTVTRFGTDETKTENER